MIVSVCLLPMTMLKSPKDFWRATVVTLSLVIVLPAHESPGSYFIKLLSYGELRTEELMRTPIGQTLSESNRHEQTKIPIDATFEEVFVIKHRKLIGVLIPLVLFYAAWLCLAIRYDLFDLFPKRFEMSLVMIFGATVAGMTTEGGGAIAFPIMTLILKIEPIIARDFSIMIQSCGMSAASFTIFWMQIVVEWRSVFFCSIGAIFGVTLGFTFLDPLLNASQKKMMFVSIFFSFALALYLLNMRKKRITFNKIQNFNGCKAFILVCTGFFGGVFTSIVGSGVDVWAFSIVTLLFNVSEKVATPTSVILMAFNSLVGFFWRQLIMADVSQVAWEYLAVCLPVVVIFAPLGSMLASHFHRLVLAYFIYFLETLALIGGFVVVRPNWRLTIASIALIAGAFTFFFLLSRIGAKMIKHQEKYPLHVKNVLLPDDIDLKHATDV